MDSNQTFDGREQIVNRCNEKGRLLMNRPFSELLRQSIGRSEVTATKGGYAQQTQAKERQG